MKTMATSDVQPQVTSEKMLAKPKAVSAKRPVTEWLIPAALILLSIVPVLAGAVRMTQLASGAAVTADNARFFASPTPVVLHIISITLYALLGAFQFAPGFRRQHRRWHRVAGWLLIPSGLIAALSGLWMAHFYAWPQYDGLILYGQRLVFGTAMFLSLIMAIIAIRQRNFSSHGAWMIRAYAIGMGAGTQVFTHLPWLLLPALHGEGLRALCMGAGWVINLVVAEWLIRTRLAPPTKRRTAARPLNPQRVSS